MKRLTSTSLVARFVLLGALLFLPVFANADGLSDIHGRKVLRIGVCEFAPWTFTNRGGQLEGFEIDNGRQLAFDLGVAPEFKVYPLDAILGAVDRGEIDVIAAGLAITPARALLVEFSSPYFESGTTLVTNKQLAPGVKRAEDLNQKGFVVAVVAETFSAGLAQQLYDIAEVKTFPDATAAEKELSDGHIHGYLTSVPEARILAKRHAATLETPLASHLIGSVAGFAVKRGNQSLLNFLNAWTASHLADRWLPSSYNYWFDGYDWLQHTKN